jgi:putative heme-binding domain-containing protein
VLLSVAAVVAEPVVHMLVPGFTVRELPIRLSNINNLRFAPDGRLTALGYDGRIHLLRDTDGDGLEDADELFWDKSTITVPVGMAWSKEGLYVSSHGKVSLLRDTDGDGKADTEEIIASGWPPTDVGSGGVDATAATLDKEGNVYFGLLVADYSNAYRLRKRKDLKPEEIEWLKAHGDKGGNPEEEVSLYDIQSKRGTIQKWNRRTKQLETIATGIRVPYALLFNKAGDLFCTDQEGETWMPNGNPLDELNHIIPGHNYGFPPRHEKWLPNLISEPPVVAFGPQHQSTCGFVFNEPEAKSDRSPGRKLFGPKWWEGDAFVAGESRGKIWRVRLVKTPHGYVGKEFLIARLSMLTTDVTISPKGDLYISCHSGPPDWGTGPQGEGKIFKISYTDPKAPQPVIAWAAGPTEVRVAFDKALDPSVTNTVIGQLIEFGEYVRAADRYEVLKPPYQVVKQQEATPRGKLKTRSAKLENKQQTLVLAAERHESAVTYQLTIPGVRANRGGRGGEMVDVDYDLSGVQIVWGTKPIAAKLPNPLRRPALDSGVEFLAEGETAERWMPYPDLAVSEKFLFPLSTRSEDFGMARAKLADTYLLSFRVRTPLTVETIHLSSTNVFNVFPKQGTGVATWNPNSALYEYDFEVPIKQSQNQLYVGSVGRVSPIVFGCRGSDDNSLRPLQITSFRPDWFTSSRAISTNDFQPIQTGAGDFERGRDLFFSDQLKCSTCHRIRGEGGAIGADLSNLAYRDVATVLRDIKEPSAAINPDYVSYSVVTSDGTDLSGFVKEQEANALRLMTADGKEHVLPRSEIREMRVSSVSLMPTGLLDALKEEQVRDLLTFLLSEPPKRTRAEVEATLNASKHRQSPIANRKLEIVLVASKQDHGPGQHDYPAWQKKWQALLGQAANVVVSTAWEWPSKEQFQTADVIVLYFWNHDWNAERYQQLDEYLARGGGMALFHSATIADNNPEQLAERIGLASQPQRTKYRHTPLDLKIVAPPDDPITLGLPRQIHFLDEPYWPMIGDASGVEVLATTIVEGEERPMIWRLQKAKGRVFASILGHYTWTFDDPLFRLLALRGIAWTAGDSEGRFEKLAAPEVNLN